MHEWKAGGFMLFHVLEGENEAEAAARRLRAAGYLTLVRKATAKGYSKIRGQYEVLAKMKE